MRTRTAAGAIMATVILVGAVLSAAGPYSPVRLFGLMVVLLGVLGLALVLGGGA